MNQQLTHSTKDFFATPVVQQKLQELLGKNAQSFATSVLQVVNSNDMLKSADPMTIFSAACMAATLNLPINNSLGFAYIVPFRNNKANRTEAQFQLGYKGFIQLAQRSGQFSRIASTPVYEGQLISENPLLGYEFDWNVKPQGEPIGYVAFFKLINGFTAELYMSRDEIVKHSQRYSQTAKKGFGVWKDNFDAMAQKTVLKLLLSKQAPLSIDMPLTTAMQADQAVIRDVEDGQIFVYEDNQPTQPAIEMNLDNDPALLSTVVNQIQNGTLDKADVLSGNAGYIFANEATRQALAGA